MKKFLKISGIVILVLFLLLLILPFAFQGKIMKIAKEQINNNLNAKVDFGKISLSLIRNFPNVSLGVKDIYVAGIGDFEKDTLFSARSVNVVVDLVSAIKMENIRIKRIYIGQPRIYARVLENGKANWDIMKETGEEETDTTSGEFHLELKHFELDDAFIRYEDDEGKIYTSLDKMDFVLSGDMSQDFTTLKINSTTGLMNVIYDGMHYLKNVSLAVNLDVDADLNKYIFTLRDNTFNLNELVLKFEGTFSMPNDTDMIFDLKYGLQKTDFKPLLSLIPAIYMKDFKDVQASGQIAMNGTVKGTYNDKTMPNVQLTMKVNNGMFKYPSLPKSADHIGIDMNLFYDGVQADNSLVDVNHFHVELGGNPVDMSLNVKTPVSDMYVNGNIKMDLDLSTVNDVIPLDSTVVTGQIKGALDFMGFVSAIENGQYDKFKANGSMSVRDLKYSSPDIPRAFQIMKSDIIFSAQYLDIQSFNAAMGKSDFNLSGKLENFIPYAFKDETLKGSFIFTSGMLDLNEFMSSEETTNATDTAALEIVPVPANLDLKLVSRLDKILYDKLQIENAIGTILVKESKVILDGLKLNMLNGSMQLSGEYNTKDIKNPMVDFDFKVNSLDIPSAFSAFTTLQKFAPAAENAIGKVNLSMKYSSYLDQHMMPVMNSIEGKGNFSSDEVGLKKSAMFEKIGSALKTKAFDNMVLKKLSINFEIQNGRLLVDPFETNLGNTTLMIGGDQGLDQTMNYTVGIGIPRSDLGSGANAVIDNLISKASSAGLNVDPMEKLVLHAKVTGTFSDPKVGLDMKSNTRMTKDQIKAQVVETVKEQIDLKKEEARAAAQAEVDKIMANAGREADALRAKAAQSADIIRKEANTNAENLVKKANDPISKKAAEVGAKKIKQEGESSAQKVINEADARANDILKKAREQGDKLLAP